MKPDFQIMGDGINELARAPGAVAVGRHLTVAP